MFAARLPSLRRQDDGCLMLILALQRWAKPRKNAWFDPKDSKKCALFNIFLTFVVTKAAVGQFI
jgi:hypothetical protein